MTVLGAHHVHMAEDGTEELVGRQAGWLVRVL